MVPFEQFQSIVMNISAIDTSADPEHWSTDNQLWGHCAVVSLLAQDLYGGELVRHSLEQVQGYEYLRSHYTNQLPDGREFDFTALQFSTGLPENLPREVRPRERVLAHPDTRRRYELLKSRFSS
ncbi:MAG: hypothetical protein JNK33_05360 [Candidatus Doudnabacteria bacterium]|nr:hypothetical protein [Candidatus Doudnabacteria bacterium]